MWCTAQRSLSDSSETALLRIPGDGVHGDDLFGRSYDLAAAGIGAARFVRLEGLGATPMDCANGFDADAIGGHVVQLIPDSAPAELRV